MKATTIRLETLRNKVFTLAALGWRIYLDGVQLYRIELCIQTEKAVLNRVDRS